jgi:hypothetical protein
VGGDDHLRPRLCLECHSSTVGREGWNPLYSADPSLVAPVAEASWVLRGTSTLAAGADDDGDGDDVGDAHEHALVPEVGNSDGVSS